MWSYNQRSHVISNNQSTRKTNISSNRVAWEFLGWLQIYKKPLCLFGSFNLCLPFNNWSFMSSVNNHPPVCCKLYASHLLKRTLKHEGERGPVQSSQRIFVPLSTCCITFRSMTTKVCLILKIPKSINRTGLIWGLRQVVCPENVSNLKPSYPPREFWPMWLD